MNVLCIDYSMATQSLDIFFSGCNMGHHCPGCHNSEAWDFSVGSDWSKWIEKINKNLAEFGPMISRVFILGGEPLDQDQNELKKFLGELRLSGKELWLFTRYELEDISSEVKQIFDYIKTGPYREDLTVKDNISYGVRLATSNQKVHKKGVDY